MIKNNKKQKIKHIMLIYLFVTLTTLVIVSLVVKMNMDNIDILEEDFVQTEGFWSYSLGEQDSLVGKYLVYSNTYRTINNGVTKEYLVIGHYDFLENNQVKINYFFYDAAHDKIEGTTNKKHNAMNAPYGGSCIPGYVHIPSYEQYKQFNGTWSVEGDLLKIQVGSVMHEWKLEDSKNKFYKLNKPYYNASTGSHIINGVTFTNSISFGYISDKVILQDPINKGNLLENYKGELYQNNGISTSSWKYYNSGLSASLFNVKTDPNVLGYSYSCGYSGYPNMWCLSTLLLNYAPYSKLLVYNNGGHDYNEDGCYNEFGHRKQMFGIMEDSKITKMVFIEYSYETDGYPIISVGRYYQSECLVDADCDDDNLCTDDSCVNSQCQNINNDLNNCNDNDLCTVNDKCSVGRCLGISKNCDDGIPCSVDSCANGFCQYDLINCLCTNDQDCEDNNVCTDNYCDLSENSCKQNYNNNSCNDNDLCTIEDKCSIGICSGTPKNCDDGIPCSVDSCANGFCQQNISSCSCQNDSNCEDNNVCTDNYCDLAENSCEQDYNNNSCNDNNEGTFNDRCQEGQCIGKNLCNFNEICEVNKGENCENCIDCYCSGKEIISSSDVTFFGNKKRTLGLSNEPLDSVGPKKYTINFWIALILSALIVIVVLILFFIELTKKKEFKKK